MSGVGDKLITVDDLKVAYDELDDNKINKTNIANNLTTTTTGSVLDATQGKALKDSVDVLPCYVLDCGTVSSLPKTIPSSGTNANITSDMVVLKAVFGTPLAQTSDWTVTANDGNLVISGSISGSTTLKLYLMKSR